MAPTNPNITYSVGGTVQASGGYYVERSADGELLDLCLKGEFAYVLTSRQMGKSSLMVRTAETLRQRKDIGADQTVPVIVDLTGLGTPGDQETWYRGFLLEVVRKLDQELKLRGEAELVPQLLQWWQQQAEAGMGVTQRFTQFFADVILAQVPGRVVVFVDEIDTTLSLAYTDDFFIAIRYFFTSRAENPAFQRLSFVLLGVATPGDLIIDSRRTPFNIGRRVELTDFTLAEATPLKEGLGLEPQQAEAIFEQVWAWTGGHPYLTQRLCGALQSRGGSVPLLGGVRGGSAVSSQGLTHPPAPSQEGEIDPLVQDLFLGEGSEKDNNLQFVRDMLTLRAPGEDVLGVLQVYREIWRGQEVLDEEQSLVKNHLKLSGLVKRQGQRLVVRNRVYQQVFDEAWLRKHWPLNLWQRLKLAWPFIAASFAVTVIVGSLGVMAFQQRQLALQQQRRAEEALVEVEQEKNRAETNAQRAAESARQAEANAAEAERQKGFAELQTKIGQQKAEEARQNATRATEQTTLAQARQQVAEQAQQEARTAQGLAEEQKTLALSAQADATRQAEVARLREQAAVVLNWLPTRRAPQGMALALQTYASSKNKDVAVPVLKVAESSLLSAVQRMKESHKLLGHEGAVNAVAFSPAGDRIVSGSDDGTLRLWDLQGNQIGEPFQGHTDYVRSVAFSPPGDRIVSGSDDRTLRLWDLQGNQIGEPFQGNTESVRSVAFSPRGNRIISGSVDGNLRLWDLQGNQIGQPFQGHGSVNSVEFSPKGDRILSGNLSGTLELWDLQGSQIGQPFQGHTDSISSVAFSPRGNHIVSGSDDGTLRLWDLQGNQISEPLQNNSDINSVAFSLSGDRIVSGSDDGTLRLWDLQGNQIGEPLRGHSNSVNSVAFSLSGDRIVSGSDDGTLRLWDLQGNQIGQPFQGHSAAFSPRGNRIISGSDDGTLRLWDLQGNQIGEPLRGHSNSVNSVAFSLSGDRIISGSSDGTLRLWDLQGNQIGQPFQGYGSVNSVEFSPKGDRILSESWGYDLILRLQLWDLQGNQIGQPFQGHSAEFSPRGERIVSGSDDGTLRLWDLQGNQIGQPFQGHTGYVNSVEFSPRGDRIISSSVDGTLRLWDLQGNQIGQPFQGHTDSVWSVAFSPRGNRIVSGSLDDTLRLWDLQGNQIGQPFQNNSDVNSVAFSPSGDRVISSSNDGFLRLWDLQGQPIGDPFQGYLVVFSPRGDRIVSGSDDGTLRLWAASPDAWFRIGCDRLRYHPLFRNPEQEIKGDPELLRITLEARDACQRRVWDGGNP